MSTMGNPERSDWLKAFGAAVRERRVQEGLSQEALGFRCGLDRTYVSGIERGVRNLSIWNVQRLALGLGTAASDLLARAEDALRSE